MKIGHGIVKKYSREYHRTLKTGEKKKYTTEQIQITVSKNEDIYSNKENVLIIPQAEIETFNNLEEELHANRVANYLYMMEVEKLEQLLKNEDSSEYEKTIEELKQELHSKENEIQILEAQNAESKNDTLAILKEENDKIKTKHTRLIEENENLKNKYVNMKIENENLKTKYSSIKEENKNLKTKCSTLKEERADIKSSYDNVTSKYDQLKRTELKNLF